MAALCVKACRAGDGVVHEFRNVRGQVGAHHAVADAPARHRIGFREAVEEDGALLHAGHRGDREGLPSNCRRV